MERSAEASGAHVLTKVQCSVCVYVFGFAAHVHIFFLVVDAPDLVLDCGIE